MTSTTRSKNKESEDEPLTIDNHPVINTNHLLGVDGKSNVHYYCAVQSRLVVCKHRNVIHDRELPAKALEAWIDAMEEQFGEWRILDYLPEREMWSTMADKIADGVSE